MTWELFSNTGMSIHISFSVAQTVSSKPSGKSFTPCASGSISGFNSAAYSRANAIPGSFLRPQMHILPIHLTFCVFVKRACWRTCLTDSLLSLIFLSIGLRWWDMCSHLIGCGSLKASYRLNLSHVYGSILLGIQEYEIDSIV